MPGQTSTLKKLFWNAWREGILFSNAQTDNIAREVDAIMGNPQVYSEYYKKVEGGVYKLSWVHELSLISTISLKNLKISEYALLLLKFTWYGSDCFSAIHQMGGEQLKSARPVSETGHLTNCLGMFGKHLIGHWVTTFFVQSPAWHPGSVGKVWGSIDGLQTC